MAMNPENAWTGRTRRTSKVYFARYKKSRFWGVYDPTGVLICVCVYKKGAEEVIRRLPQEEGKASENDANVSVSTGNCDADCGSRRCTGASRANA